MFDRLLSASNNIFNQRASERWRELRNTILEEDDLIDNISKSYNFLLSNANYERESLKWGQESIKLSNLEYTYEWLGNRLDFLDIYFGEIILDINKYLDTLEGFSVSPNPVTSSFKISIDNESVFYAPFDIFYSIFDANGTFLKKGTLHENELIDIDNFSNGIYFVKINTNKNNQIASLKVVKQ